MRVYPDESPRHPEDRRRAGDGSMRWVLWLAMLAVFVVSCWFFLAALP